MDRLEFFQRMTMIIRSGIIDDTMSISELRGFEEAFYKLSEDIDNYYRDFIIKSLQEKGVTKEGYDNWYDLLGDSEGAECEAYARYLFTEEDLELIYLESR